jgi:TonB family protein
MAIPSRLTSAARPIARVTKSISPTGIGVLLSVVAHLALLAFGPRTDFSFAALSQAAQETEEETIVPLVQLTPAERNRLPSFAQSRLQSPNPNGLGSLALPSGLPSVPNTSLPRRQAVPANPFPSATSPFNRRTPQPLNRTLPSNVPVAGAPNRLNLGVRQPPRVSVVVPNTPAVPPAPAIEPPAPSDNSNANTRPDPTDGLPQLEPGMSIAEALESTEARGTRTVPDIGDQIPAGEPGGEAGGEAVEIPVEESPEVAAAPTQPSTEPLLGSGYDETNVSEEAAQATTEAWIAAIAQNQSDLATATAELTIDSEFKACRETPPANGRVGVVVNPDGSQSDAQVLKSTGYDVLNRQALAAVERYDFGQLEAPTQYQVNIEVLYNSEGCVDTPPQSAPEGDG